MVEEVSKLATMQARPAVDEHGAIILYDIYVTTTGSPQWIGSRRTLEQCQEAFDNYFRSSPDRGVAGTN